jgi:hypothetical protein
MLLAEHAGTAPRDELLRKLQLGLVFHRAGRWAESNAAFEWAERAADDRYARSLHQSAGTLLVNDGVSDYRPARPEMAMIPYYRMLNYLALGQQEEALVEARKASALVSGLNDDGKRQPCAGEGFVEYLAGLVYRSAGDRNDALVSFRGAERAFDACSGRGAGGAPPELGTDLFHTARALGVREVADSARARYKLVALPAAPGAGTGELVVLVEHGWVAHRAPQDIHVPIAREEMDSLDGRDDAFQGAAAARISGRLIHNLLEQSVWGSAADEDPGYQVADALGGAYILRMAWPVYRMEACAPQRLRVVVADSGEAEPMTGDPRVVQDLSSAMVRSFEATRPLMFTRMVGRGIAKYLVTRELERHADKKGGEFAGFLAGRLANAAGNALERADTRSWSLLPDRISVSRFSLPAGEHRVRIEVLAADGSVAETLDLGTVKVAAGSTVFRSQRVWGGEMGDLGGLAQQGESAALAAAAEAAPEPETPLAATAAAQAPQPCATCNAAPRPPTSAPARRPAHPQTAATDGPPAASTRDANGKPQPVPRRTRPHPVVKTP